MPTSLTSRLNACRLWVMSLWLGTCFSLALPHKEAAALAVKAGSNKASVNTQKRPNQLVKLFIWERYLSPQVILDLDQQFGYALDITTYSTNEVAVARLASHQDDIDVAIISNLAYEVLRPLDVLATGGFSHLNRAYLPMFEHSRRDCLPFHWLVSGYLYDPRVASSVPNTMDALLSLAKNKDVYAGVVDDGFEVWHRILGDHQGDRRVLAQRYPPEDWRAVRFIYDIPNFSPHQALVAFTWHGMAKTHLRLNPTLRFALPPENLLVGYDMVCVLKKSDAAHQKSLRLFAERLTERPAIENNIAQEQYFSPYRQASTAGFDPAILPIYEASRRMVERGSFTLVTSPPAADMPAFNQWWRPRRYAQ